MPDRLIFIGDVHGMSDQLKDLLDRLTPSTEDELIFVGDLVDKGPDPVGTVRVVSQFIHHSDIETTLLRGNHEDKHLRYRLRLQDSPKVARKMGESSPELVQFMSDAADEDWDTLLKARHFWRNHDRNLLAVHGGIPGDMWSFPHDWDEVERLERHDQRSVEKIYRTRFVDHYSGAFIASGHQTPDDPFWAERYDGRFGDVIFGHEPFFDGPREFPHATGIDTAAVYGGQLTALIIHADDSREYVSVDCPAYRKPGA